MNDWICSSRRVICVDDRFPPSARSLCRGGLPSKGRTYTIRDVLAGDMLSPTPAITLVQIINPAEPAFLEPHFFAWRFRPLVERPTDISALRRVVENVMVTQ